MAWVISAITFGPGLSPSSAPLVHGSSSTISAQPSDTHPVAKNAPVRTRTPELCKPPVLRAWNGTNSQINLKAAASRSKPVPPTTKPSVMATVQSTTPLSLTASDPPPRPKVPHAHLGTAAMPSVFQRRTTSSLQLRHNLSRVADGEPRFFIIPERRSRRSSHGSRN